MYFSFYSSKRILYKHSYNIIQMDHYHSFLESMMEEIRQNNSLTEEEKENELMPWEEEMAELEYRMEKGYDIEPAWEEETYKNETKND